MERQPLLHNNTGNYGGCGDQVYAGDGGGANNEIGGGNHGDGGDHGQVGAGNQGDGVGQAGAGNHGDGGDHGQVGAGNHGDGGDQAGAGNHGDDGDQVGGRGQVSGDNLRGETVNNDHLLDWVFYFLCFLSGQLMLDFVRKTSSNKQRVKFFVMAILELPLFILFLLLHAGVLAFNIYAIILSNIKHDNLTSGAYETKRTKFISSLTSHMVGINAHDAQRFEVTLEVVFTMSTLSGSLSYLIMTFVLVTNYSCIHTLFEDTKSRLCQDIKWSRPYEERHILNPFPLTPVVNGHREYYKRVPLCAPQSYCFFFIFLLNLILFVFYVGIPLAISDVHELIQYSLSHETNKTIENVGFVILFSSQYGTIISCFIFSKVAYAVTIECNRKMEDFQGILNNERVNTPQQEEDALHRFQDEDKAFYKLSNWSTSPYRVWFTVHWFFYAVTAFLSIGFLVEIILHKRNGCGSVCMWGIGYLFLFTLEHTILFLYPCFRAASIKAARNSLIKRVCNENIENMPTKLKAVFVQYMKERKCGFKLSIFCASIEFGFNIAYISIFLGLIGIVLKLSVY